MTSDFESIDFKDAIFPKLKNMYPSLIIDGSNSSKDEVCLRLHLKEKDVKPLLEYFSNISNTEWICYSKSMAPEKLIYRQTWICHHSNHRKRKDKSTRNAYCRAKFDVRIKKVNPNTIKNDPFLKGNFPLDGKIIISLCHSHNLSTAEILKMLRVDNETKEQFFEYFANGMTVAEATYFHESRFLIDKNYNDLANASVNPTPRQVGYLYDCWRNQYSESTANPYENLQRRANFHESFAGNHPLKRNNLKKNAVPSLYLPTSNEDNANKEDSEISKKIKKVKLNNKIKNKNTALEHSPDKRKFLCLEETNSDESTVKEESKMEASSNSIVEQNEETTDTSSSVTQLRIIVPNYSVIDANTIEPTSKNVEKYMKDCTVSLLPVNLGENSKLDYSVFKSSPNDSKEVLAKKLDTMVSVTELLKKKVSFFQNKCKMYEREVNIMKGVINNLKQINSATFDN